MEADDWLEHGLALDLSGWDQNAAVHEVSNGTGQLFFTIGKIGLQAEDLLMRGRYGDESKDQVKLILIHEEMGT